MNTYGTSEKCFTPKKMSKSRSQIFSQQRANQKILDLKSPHKEPTTTVTFNTNAKAKSGHQSQISHYQNQHVHQSVVNTTPKLPSLATLAPRPQAQHALERTHHVTLDAARREPQRSKGNPHQSSTTNEVYSRASQTTTKFNQRYDLPTPSNPHMPIPHKACHILLYQRCLASNSPSIDRAISHFSSLRAFDTITKFHILSETHLKIHTIPTVIADLLRLVSIQKTHSTLHRPRSKNMQMQVHANPPNPYVYHYKPQ